MNRVSLSIFNNSIKYFITLLLSISYVYAITTALYYPFTLIHIVCICAPVVFFLFIIFLNKKTKIGFLSILTLTLVLGIAYLIYNKLWNYVKHLLYNFIYSMIQSFITSHYITIIEASVITIILSIILCFLIYIFVNKINRIWLSLFFGIIIFSVLWIFNFLKSDITFYIFCFATLLSVTQKFYNQMTDLKDHTFVKSVSYTICSLFFVGIIFSTSFFLTETLPDALSFMTTTVEGINDWFKPSSTSKNGVEITRNVILDDNEVELHNKFEYKDNTIMIVDSPRPMYLKGSTLNIYTGKTWNNSNDEKFNFRKNKSDSNLYRIKKDSATLYGLSILSSDYLNYNDKDYFFDDVINVTYNDIVTDIVFSPLYSYEVELDFNENFYNDIYGQVTASKILPSGFNYSIKTKTINKNATDLTTLLRKSFRGFYENIKNNNVRNTLIAESNFVYSNYLQVPESLPQRVRDLAHELTDKYDNNYDKVIAIEKYLSKNYKYNLAPPETPDNFDFIDYFLFESKEGFCTYYASSMAILCRCVGIPSRYTKGFILPPKDTDDLEEDDEDYFIFNAYENDTIYNVKEEHSHSWPEIYFEGFGWMNFEPTAPYYEEIFDSENIENKDDLLDYEKDTEEKNIKTNYFSNINFKELGKTFMIILPILFVLSLLILPIIKKIYYTHKYRKMTNNAKIITNIKRTLDLLTIMGYSKNPSETLNEYFNRIADNLVFSDIHFNHIYKTFESSIYGNITATEEEALHTYAFYKNIRNKTYKYANKFLYFYHLIVTKI